MDKNNVLKLIRNHPTIRQCISTSDSVNNLVDVNEKGRDKDFVKLPLPSGMLNSTSGDFFTMAYLNGDLQTPIILGNGVFYQEKNSTIIDL